MQHEHEARKQQAEVEAWLTMVGEKGRTFLTESRAEGDLTPYEGSVILDIGCGPRPFVEHFPAAYSFMVDCCMADYARNELIVEGTPEATCCVDAMAETLPFKDGIADHVFGLNMLDHTYDPQAVVDEMIRVLKPGGHLHVHVDIGGQPNECEPNVFTIDEVLAFFGDMTSVYHDEQPASNPSRDKLLMVIYRKGDPGEIGTDASSMVELLRCPVCNADLAAVEGGGHACSSCSRDYAIEKGVHLLKP